MKKKIIIQISNNAQKQVKKAIEWNSVKIGNNNAKIVVKSAISDWQNQMQVAPESGTPTQYIDNQRIRECIKGDYRLTYEIIEENDCFKITLLIFCHTRQDYQSLLKLL